MTKILTLIFVALLLVGCGVDTRSQRAIAEQKEATRKVLESSRGGADEALRKGFGRQKLKVEIH